MGDDGRIVSIAQMAAADAAAVTAGIASSALMENAGRAVAEAIMERLDPVTAVVLCGPGNNGGDGFVVARRLAEAGWQVRVGLLGSRDRLRGDAAGAAAAWPGGAEALDPALLRGAGLVVDALFGAGLSRALEGNAKAMIEAVRQAALPVVAVDIPSGVHGDSGEVLGDAAPAVLTVTFHRPKPGHFLLPGRMCRGELLVAKIGIPEEVTDRLGIKVWINRPLMWSHLVPRRTPMSHKYRHGHALVVGGGPASSGAARLAARAALRAGAGAVTVVCPEAALAIYAAQLTAVMIAPVRSDADFSRQLEDPRRNGVLLGPGGGTGAPLRRKVTRCLRAGKVCVLDADALTSFADEPQALFNAIGGQCLLTPHEGEFARLFKLEGDRLTRARGAAEQSGAVVLLKGGDTVVAAPDGPAMIQPEAPPTLATAGSGDVLAGIALGLAVQGMPMFEAAAAAVWLHAAAARVHGPGLIAEDLTETLPSALAEVMGDSAAAPA